MRSSAVFSRITNAHCNPSSRLAAAVVFVALAVGVVACGTVEPAPLSAKDAAGGDGAVGGIGGTTDGTAGGAGQAAGGAGGEAGKASSGQAGAAAGSSGSGGSSGGSNGEAGHPDVSACPRPIAAWGTQCPNKYPDGTTCVLGCIYDNTGQTYDPPGGSCYVKADSVYNKPFVCINYFGGSATCASCPR